MDFEAGEKAIIKDIAFEVGETIIKRLNETLTARIKLHQLSCPTADEVNKWRGQAKGLVIGIALGAALVGTGGTIGFLKLFKFF